MMRSMYSGVAGLKTHQTKMDVIGNNIANVNTVAYKSQSVTFSELMYQTTQNASGANALTGTAGINARQIGLGVKMGAINTAIATEGATQTTNNPFDIRITGDSFFIVSNGNDTFFTRDGSFYVDGAGNLAMTSNGYNVMGWQVDPETMDIKMETVSALRVMSPENMTYPPEATSKAYVAGILDQNDTDVRSSSGKTMNLQFYDNLGYSYTAKLILRNAGETKDGKHRYTVELSKVLDSNNKEVKIGDAAAFASGTKVTDTKNIGLRQSSGYKWNGMKLADPEGNEVFTAGAGNTPTEEEWVHLATAYGYGDNVDMFKTMTVVKDVAYDSDGDGTNDATATVNINIGDVFADKDVTLGGGVTRKATAIAGAADATSAFEIQQYEIPGTVELVFDGKTGKFESIGGPDNDTVTLNFDTIFPDGRFSDIEVDFSNTTMYNNAGVSTIAATNGDTKGLGSGRKLGQMSGVSISNDGRIYASYDNGQSKLLGQIAVAEFSNASGLEKDGDNLYKATQNSGDFDGIGQDIMADGGYMTTGVLEMSNVDLSSEFTEMITTQRGFQANSRIITVSDTLLEELINLKR